LPLPQGCLHPRADGAYTENKEQTWDTLLILFRILLQDPKNCESHIDASYSQQPLVKGERLVGYDVNAVMIVLLWQA